MTQYNSSTTESGIDFPTYSPLQCKFVITGFPRYVNRGRYAPSFWTANFEFSDKSPFLT
jgi:hypothetical protein